MDTILITKMSVEATHTSIFLNFDRCIVIRSICRCFRLICFMDLFPVDFLELSLGLLEK